MFALYDKTTGRIRQYQSCPDCPDDETGSLDIGANYIGVADAYFVQTGALMQRLTKPVVPASGAHPHQINLAAFAAGSTITATNEAGETASFAPSGTLTLADPGRYQIKIDQPFPHHSFQTTVEVT